MVSTGQGDVGAAKLSGEVLNIVAKVPELVKSMTGVDLVKVSLDVLFNEHFLLNYVFFL